MIRKAGVPTWVAVMMAGLVLASSLRPASAQSMDRMRGHGLSGVRGYTEGQVIRFIHTEASDPMVAQMLTRMMRSPVLVVPSLAQAPESMLANVYVFANGVKGDGPLGFQSDVFDNPPGTPGYSPLRVLNRVTWTNPRSARVLKSVAHINEAVTKGEITIERPGVVINMPMVTWPGGHR